MWLLIVQELTPYTAVMSSDKVYIYIHLYLVSLTIFDLLYIFREKQMIYFAFKLSLFLPISLISIFHLDYILRCVFEKWPNVTLHCLRYLCRLCFLYHIINFGSVAEFAQLLYRFVESFLFPSNHLILFYSTSKSYVFRSFARIFPDRKFWLW